MTQKYEVKSFEYMNDVKYLFLPEQLIKDNVKELWFSVKSSKMNAVYLVVYDARPINGPVQVVQSVFDFLPIHESRIVYLHFEDFAKGFTAGQVKQLDINLVKVVGDVKANFRICNGQPDKCLQVDSLESNAKEIFPADTTYIGMKTSFKFKVDPKDFLMFNEYEREAVIIIYLKNSMTTPSLMAL